MPRGCSGAGGGEEAELRREPCTARESVEEDEGRPGLQGIEESLTGGWGLTAVGVGEEKEATVMVEKKKLGARLWRRRLARFKSRGRASRR
jgi:hypothetical protein